MIYGHKVARPTKAAIAADIARVRGLPAPHVSNGASVDSQFLDAVYESLAGVPSGAADAYRKTEALLERLALTYDPYWDTSESSATGGSTVTTRTYSRIRTALTGVPRCFILSVTDAPVGERWETDPEKVYRYDTNVTARMPLNDAGPGSRIVYYATSKSTTNPKRFIAAATIAHIAPGWDGPWEARLEDYATFRSPVPVDELDLPGWNRQHAITEISFETYQALLAAGEVGDAIAAPVHTVADLDEAEIQDTDDDGGARIAERILRDFAIEEAEPSIELPDSLPAGTLTGGQLVVAQYTESPAGVIPDDPNLLPARSRNTKRDKMAELRAIQLATKALELQGWELSGDRQKDGVGYDLEFEKAASRLKVEVKGIQGPRLAFNITPKELWRAQTDPEWVLIAVTSVLSPAGYRLQFVTRDRVAGADRAATGYRIAPPT